MFSAIYFEEEVKNSPRVEAILQQYPQLPHIPIDRYTEIFNVKKQNFRLQKKKPSLILAKKHKNFVLQTPPSYSIGGSPNYYFSHMMNCVFDCRYCFLQGMYQSANYVLFVNYENFFENIEKHLEENAYFFSGYDCDSLALENLTHFSQQCVDFFAKRPKSFLELRTKSTNIVHLTKRKPVPNVVVAFTLTPEKIASTVEHRAPSLPKRLEALRKLQGWPLGLRFDPLLYCDNWQEHYASLFEQVHAAAPNVHSITLGPLRFPKKMHKKMVNLYPKAKVLSLGLQERGSLISYQPNIEKIMLQFSQRYLSNLYPESKLFIYGASV